MVVYTLVCASLSGPAIDLQKMPILAEKSFFQMKLMKLGKIVAFGPQNTRTHTLKSRRKQTTVCSGSRGIIGPFFFENEQKEAVTVNGDRYRAMLNGFLFTKIEEEDIGNIFIFNRTALRATQPKLYSMFCALFLNIALLAGRNVLLNKKRNLRKYSVVFLQAFSKNKRYLADPLLVYGDTQ